MEFFCFYFLFGVLWIFFAFIKKLKSGIKINSDISARVLLLAFFLWWLSAGFFVMNAISKARVKKASVTKHEFEYM